MRDGRVQPPRREKGWSITGHSFGFYYNSFHATRKGAIEQHTAALGKTWEQCRRGGDRCIKTELRPIK